MDSEPTYQVIQIPLSDLTPDPLQPRKSFKESAIQELAASIQQHGVLQPLLVRPMLGPESHGKYCIVAGERRWRAAQRVGLETAPCHVRPYHSSTAAVVALAENVHRVDLSEMEKAESLFRIRTLTGQTWLQVAQLVNLSTDYVKRLAGLLKLEERVKEWVREGKLSTRVAIALRPLSPRQQVEMAERVIREGLTAEQIRREVNPASRARTKRAAPRASSVASLSGAEAGGEGGALDTLRDLARRVEQMDAWVASGDWSPGCVSPEEQQALDELRQKVSLLQRRLLALSAPPEEAPGVRARPANRGDSARRRG